MDIACLQHVPFEGPGEIATWAEARGHRLEQVRLYEVGHAHPREADMLVVMGGPMSIHDEAAHPFLAPEKRYVSSMIESGALVLGVCLGAQLIADVLGARVYAGEHTEIGWYPVMMTTAGASCPVLGRLPATMSVLHWHGETFSIPAEATHAYSSQACANQAFSYAGGRVVGLQFHLEQNPESLRALAQAAAGDLVEGEWIQTAETLFAGGERFTAANEVLFTLLDAMSAARAG
jgi:GMP synthase-like glutamine amidotransferase